MRCASPHNPPFWLWRGRLSSCILAALVLEGVVYYVHVFACYAHAPVMCHLWTS